MDETGKDDLSWVDLDHMWTARIDLYWDHLKGLNMKNLAMFLPFTLLMASVALAGKPLPSSPELITKGQVSYKTNCAVCHGDQGDGNGPAGASLIPKARNFISEKYKFGSKPEQVFKTISEGSKNTSMAGFAHLSEEERWGLTYFILSLKKK